jgi:FG-GAP-like repeat
LGSIVPKAEPIRFFVGNIDDRFGDDIVVLNNARVLPGDEKERFGHFFASTSSGWETKTDYVPPVQFARRDKQDRGLRMLDLHGTGLPDIIFARTSTKNGSTTTDSGAFRNTGHGWDMEPGLVPPVSFTSDDITGNPVQFADVTGGGFADMIYSYRDKGGSITCHLYQNAESDNERRSWIDAASKPELASYVPPICPTSVLGTYPLAQKDVGDKGVRFVKLDKHRLAMLVGFQPPKKFDDNGNLVPIQSCVQTPVGTSECVLDTTLFQRAAFVLDGDHWIAAPQYAPPIPFVAQIDDANSASVDLFVQLVDVNGDGLPDMVGRFKHPHDRNVEINQVWINTGDGWRLDRSISIPYALDAARWEPKALVQMVDINGDGLPDIVFSRGSSVSQTWLGTGKGWEASPNSSWAIPGAAVF